MEIYTSVLIGSGRSVRVSLEQVKQCRNTVVKLKGYFDDENKYVRCGEYCPIYYELREPNRLTSILPSRLQKRGGTRHKIGKNGRF